MEFRHSIGVFGVPLRLVSSAEAPHSGASSSAPEVVRDYGTATARLRAWPLRPTAPDINAWNYDTASARLRAWCLTVVRGVTAHLQCPITLGVIG